MAADNLYAFYGSLRIGMDLNASFSQNLHYLYSCWLKGYSLYSLGSYPYAVHSNNDSEKIKVEIFRISSQITEQEIHQIEIEAGYRLERIKINGQSVRIYLFEKPAKDQKVISGDWIEFFGC